jgi:3-methyladenine DNA glycosylase AlkC
MPTRLKDIFFSRAFVEQLADAIQQVYAAFDREELFRLVFDDACGARELKAKMRHLSHCLHQTLPGHYRDALGILLEVAPAFSGFDAMVFPDYVECYGLDHWDLSLPALKTFTPLASSEFAIRPFLVRDPERALAYMRDWAGDENHHVRRLASEGCRPRLPWGIALPVFIENPAPILPILEQLKDDGSEYVRKSVANNLNVISKDHPELVLELCERWLGQSKNTDRIVKHACRTMLKAGDRRALALFGFGDPAHIHVDHLALDREALAIGDDLHFTFDLRLDAADACGEACKVRLELGVYYRKARGNLSRKVFQFGERTLEPGSHRISRKHSFADRSTRKHHPGEHRIAIIVNGVEKAEASFALSAQSQNQ